jgi:hypothetical protein
MAARTGRLRIPVQASHSEFDSMALQSAASSLQPPNESIPGGVAIGAIG